MTTRSGTQRTRSPPASSVVALGVAAELDLDSAARAGDLPGVAVAQPLVGDLHLPAVLDLLVEDAELVADAVADGRDLQRGQRVQVAGRQPAQAAVAQPGLLLLFDQLVESQARVRPAPARSSLVDAEVEQVVAQVRPEQKLRRQVAGPLAAQVQVGLGGVDPPLLHRSRTARASAW